MHSSDVEQSSVHTVALDEFFTDVTRTGSGGILATSCTSDWRQVEPGDVFVALPDMADSCDDQDGHGYAREAVARGAIAVVCEQPVPVFDVPTYLVRDSRTAFGRLCQALVGNPTQSIPVIGVSGTHGKSTTIAIVESIFSRSGKVCGTLSSLGCYDGMSISPGMSDSPSAPSLASRMSRMEASGCTHILLEVSSKSLSQAKLAGIRLDAACITHVTDAQLEWHNSIQCYRDTERRVFEHLAPEGVSILNADDPVSTQWLSQTSNPVLSFGLEGQAEISARIIEQHSNEQIFLLIAGSESAMVRTGIVGQHHVSNCLAAAALSMAYGISLQDIAAGIEAIETLPARMQRVDCGQGYPVFVDAAHTPGALSATMRTARQLASGRVICVLGEEQCRTETEEYAIAQVVKRMADLAVVVGVMPQMEAPSLPSSKSLSEVEVAASRSEAITIAVNAAKAGDVVVITGSQPCPQPGFGSPESDVELARKILFSRNDQIHVAA